MDRWMGGWVDRFVPASGGKDEALEKSLEVLLV
jgi:hypothetical protein